MFVIYQIVMFASEIERIYFLGGAGNAKTLGALGCPIDRYPRGLWRGRQGERSARYGGIEACL
jgi:hypothetical protein